VTIGHSCSTVGCSWAEAGHGARPWRVQAAWLAPPGSVVYNKHPVCLSCCTGIAEAGCNSHERMMTMFRQAGGQAGGACWLPCMHEPTRGMRLAMSRQELVGLVGGGQQRGQREPKRSGQPEQGETKAEHVLGKKVLAESREGFDVGGAGLE